MTGGRVVVLGPTGRNFAAGMSGGVAYVYDPHNVFATRVNPGMVQLQQLADDDRQFVRATVADHQRYTDSPLAAAILADWDVAATAFRKVMPTDYERVLQVMAQAEADGLDEESTLTRVMEASRV
jgi:glutamate synthase (NADPH/NADH) large chain